MKDKKDDNRVWIDERREETLSREKKGKIKKKKRERGEWKEMTSVG